MENPTTPNVETEKTPAEAMAAVASAPKAEETPEKPNAEALSAELAALKQQLADAAPLVQAAKDAEEARKSDLQKATEQADALRAELADARLNLARSSVAEKTGLTTDVVAMLNGSTEEELLKAAQVVAEKAGRTSARTKPQPTLGNAPERSNEQDFDPVKLAEKIARKRLGF